MTSLIGSSGSSIFKTEKGQKRGHSGSFLNKIQECPGMPPYLLSVFENGVTGTGELAGQGNDVLRAWALENEGSSVVDASVPAYGGVRGRATSGTLHTDIGDAYLISGRGPGLLLADLDDLIIQTHVEMHAASLMRNNGIFEGTLFINRNPCAGGLGCSDLLPFQLGNDSLLHVVSPSGTTTYYGGKF
jgi:hypothetical protein